MTPDQYKVLNKIRERTDSNDKVYIIQPTIKDWNFLIKEDFIEGTPSIVTFTGRVALAAHEAKQ